MRLTSSSSDKRIGSIARELNNVFDQQRSLIIEVERANRELRQGISNISHDLRTPLTSASGYIQLIGSKQVTEEKKDEYLKIIENRLQSLAVLMDELFDYTQIIEGQWTASITKINACNEVSELLASYYDEFIKRNFDVKINIPDTPVYVLADLKMFQRICQNLIKNALVHGYDQFEVTIDNNEIVFSNKLVNQETLDVERMFERFYTQDLARTSGKSGLGLSIVQELTKKMNGAVTVRLTDDKLAFTLKLPVA
jgi:signal transduction histidine kinase